MLKKHFPKRKTISSRGYAATIYNIGKIEKSVPSSAKIIAVVNSKARDETLSNNIISETDSKINPSDKKVRNNLPKRQIRAEEAL